MYLENHENFGSILLTYKQENVCVHNLSLPEPSEQTSPLAPDRTGLRGGSRSSCVHFPIEISVEIGVLNESL